MELQQHCQRSSTGGSFLLMERRRYRTRHSSYTVHVAHTHQSVLQAVLLHVFVWPAGAAAATTCILDTDCGSDQFCSSDVTVSVCRCMGGTDGCDDLSTCQAKPTPPPPAPPPVVLSPCEACRQCITGIQSFVAPLRFSSDAAAQSAAFVSRCTSSFMPGDILGCRAIGQSIAYSLDGNLAKRAGALCSRLGNCTALLQSSNPSSCSMSLPGLAIGTVSLCTAQGITTGTMITPAASGEPLAVGW